MSAEAIAFAKAFNNQVEWFCGDFRDVINGQRYSLITCTEVLEHIPEELINGFICGLFDKLEQYGKVVITVPTIANPVHPKHFRHYSAEILEEELHKAGVSYKILDRHNYIKRTWIWNLYDRIFFGKKIFWRINCVEHLMYRYFKKCASKCIGDQDGEKLIVVLEKV